MKISNFCRDDQDGLVSLSATFHWEDNERESQDIFIRYGADETYFDDESIALPFLIAAVVPALRRGERRIAIVGKGVCPWLRDNLQTFMGYLIDWYWYRYDRNPNDKWIPEIESTTLTNCLTIPRRTASFYSGGVDSLYSLRRNRTNIPKGHPGSIQDAIFVHGFDMGTRPKRGTEDQYFYSVIEEMKPVLESEEINLIPVFTNIRSLDPGTDCWLDEYMGSAMSAVAHGLTGQLTDILVASTHEIENLRLCASHPLTDPKLSSYSLRIHHDGERLHRVNRVKMIAEWPQALQTLRVCFFGDESTLNCGNCPKCIRTKLELICAGKLDQAITMPGGEPTPQQVKDKMVVKHDSLPFMGTLARELQESGRQDLAVAVLACRRKYLLSHWLDPVQLLKAMDEKIMMGAIKRRVVARRKKPF